MVIWAAELRRAVRSGRALVLLGLYSMFSALVLLVVGFVTRELQGQVNTKLMEEGADPEAAARAADQMHQGVLGFLTSNDTAMMQALSQVPIVVLIVFKLTLFFLPAYIALMGFDQVSGEVGPRSIRYLTVRARRSSVLLGKFLSQATLLLGLVLVIDLAIFVYARILNPDFAFGVLAMNLLKFWGATIVFSLAYVALTTLCSSLFRSPAVSLVFNFILLFVFWLMDSVSRAVEDTNPVRFVRYLSPSYYSGNLLHPQLAEFAGSGAAYAAFAAIFLVGAYGVLRTRDL
ncbi:ABC transporter permease [Corallococcus praedator]|uniref:ABC transporter permease n=1 Tax=Corallococcus praedator TaxID=2316724 RepID=A0ABX9QLW4_9BACT|nr:MULTISPECIES: ABC transporter permease subunit [Corallococcus]RKH22604.1 ABC transporter permease [Corallococcus sp. CA031C]RKI11776.1 ABC transporter permease [Corallococcus praedator]